MTTNNAVNNGLSGSTGSGSFVGSVSPTIITPNNTGITDGSDASAGSLGEFISSIILSTSAISLTSMTPADVTSISLTAGDWDINGNIYVGGGSNNISAVSVWASTTSATQPDNALLNQYFPNGGAQGSGAGLSIPLLRINVTITTTIYLSCRAVFTSTLGAAGAIYARRVR